MKSWALACLAAATIASIGTWNGGPLGEKKKEDEYTVHKDHKIDCNFQKMEAAIRSAWLKMTGHPYKHGARAELSSKLTLAFS